MNTTPDPFDSLGLSILLRLEITSDYGQVLLVTSARTGEGKTFVARSLARRLVGLVDGPVLLADANADPGMGKRKINAETGGLFDCLATGQFLPRSVQQTSVPGLSIMPAAGHPTTSLLFRMQALTRVLHELRTRYALTVLDAGTLANTGCLAQQADGAIVVVDASRTRRDIVSGALESPHIDRARVLGVVLNRRPEYVPNWIYRLML